MRYVIGIVFVFFASIVQSANFQKGLDAYNKGDFKIAYKEWYQLAEQGDFIAQNNLGVMYDQGKGVTEDSKQAFNWYRKSAENGYSIAQNNLGYMYANGAIEWPQYGLGDTNDNSSRVPLDYKKAVYWYRKAAAQGNAEAQNNLGVMYADSRGVNEDSKQAFDWYHKAAKQGYAIAQFNLGVMYANGRGVNKNGKQAVHWYRKAAVQNYVSAQFNLGVMYINGQGVLQDYKTAYMWLNLSRYNGFKATKQAFDFLVPKMTIEKINEAQEMSKTCLKSHYKNCV